MRVALLVAAIGLFSSSAAFAQVCSVAGKGGELSSVAGGVTITSAGASQMGKAGSAFTLPSEITTSATGAATIVGANGCQIQLGPNSMASINGTGVVSIGRNPVLVVGQTAGGVGTAAAVGGGVTGGGLAAIGPGLLVFGGVATAAIGSVVVSESDDDEPASP